MTKRNEEELGRPTHEGEFTHRLIGKRTSPTKSSLGRKTRSMSESMLRKVEGSDQIGSSLSRSTSRTLHVIQSTVLGRFLTTGGMQDMILEKALCPCHINHNYSHGTQLGGHPGKPGNHMEMQSTPGRKIGSKIGYTPNFQRNWVEQLPCPGPSHPQLPHGARHGSSTHVAAQTQ